MSRAEAAPDRAAWRSTSSAKSSEPARVPPLVPDAASGRRPALIHDLRDQDVPGHLQGSPIPAVHRGERPVDRSVAFGRPDELQSSPTPPMAVERIVIECRRRGRRGPPPARTGSSGSASDRRSATSSASSCSIATPPPVSWTGTPHRSSASAMPASGRFRQVRTRKSPALRGSCGSGTRAAIQAARRRASSDSTVPWFRPGTV
jgi:hypothetical protein